MFDHILVLCTGNICRSPVAAAMLQAHLPHKTVESAGLGALVDCVVDPQAAALATRSGLGALVDCVVDPQAAALATRSGLDVSAHRGRQVSTERLRWADLILVMSEGQRAQVRAQDPAAAGKVMLLSHWLSDKPDIPDPYKKSREAFEHVHGMLQNSVKAWLPKLS